MSTQNAAARRPEEEDVKSSGLKKVVTASMAGTVVEWYEFFLYASAATLVFGKLFFPNSGTELDGIIAAFVTYAVGFVARPIGGIVFGHFGDKFGRKQLLQLSIILVGVATFLMGCLPTFQQIGYWAPALLVFLRFVQGFAVGGEWGGAVLLVLPLLVAAVPPLALSPRLSWVLVGAAFWGAAGGLQDATVKALVADLVPAPRRATAYGVFAAIQGVAALAGGATVGALYDVSVGWLTVVVGVAQAASLVLLLRVTRVSRTRAAAAA